MFTPKTASGKDCKLCKKKGPGEHCHLHRRQGGWSTASTPHYSPERTPFSSKSKRMSPGANTIELKDFKDPRYKTPAKARSPKSPKSATKKSKKFDFEHLPAPVLYKILLDVSDLKKLNSICNKSAAAYKICKLKRFQEEYRERNSKHRIFIPGKFSRFSLHDYEDNPRLYEFLRVYSSNMGDYMGGQNPIIPFSKAKKARPVITNIRLIYYTFAFNHNDKLYRIRSVQGLFEGREVEYFITGTEFSSIKKKYPDVPVFRIGEAPVIERYQIMQLIKDEKVQIRNSEDGTRQLFYFK